MYSCLIKFDMERNLKCNAHKELCFKQVNN